jgi:hypothetical protein
MKPTSKSESQAEWKDITDSVGGDNYFNKMAMGDAVLTANYSDIAREFFHQGYMRGVMKGSRTALCEALIDAYTKTH